MKRRYQKGLAIILATCMTLCGFLFESDNTVMAKEKITPSTKNYGVELQHAKSIYLCNKEPVDLKVGSKFFMTYTVTEMKSDLSTQSGVSITQDFKADYPYQKGIMQYVNTSLLLDKGKTYFFRFEMTKEGLVCTTSWAKGEESDYIGFPQVTGEIQTGCKYFGVFFSGTSDTDMVGRLTRVRCYDENGKDLGVNVGGLLASDAVVYDPVDRASMVPNTKIKNKYSITLKDNYNVAISNRKFSDSNVLFMEYTVKSVTQDKLSQSGLIYNSAPQNEYGTGIWKNEEHDMQNYMGCRLLIPGVTYFIRCTKTEEGCDVVVKYNVNGEDNYYTYPRFWGERNPGSGFLSLWFGEGPNAKVSAELVDIKCYDKEGNNLGVQTNQNIEVVHQGGLEDYSKCLAAYYHEESDSMIWLEQDQKVSIQRGDAVEIGIYVIQGNTLTVTIGDKKQEYKYLYK